LAQGQEVYEALAECPLYQHRHYRLAHAANDRFPPATTFVHAFVAAQSKRSTSVAPTFTPQKKKSPRETLKH